MLTDSSGTVTDTYDYDAFGNILNSTGVTPNEFRFAGEQFDTDLGLYYNRARYLNGLTGRFWTMDPLEGDATEPLSLHRYIYANGDPVNASDPTGLQTGVDEVVEIGVLDVLTSVATVGLLAQSLGLQDPGREPYPSRREREENPGKWLYAFGNTKGPRDPRIRGYNLQPNQRPDISVGLDGNVGPEVPPRPQGASTFANPEIVSLTGQVWKVEKRVILVTPGLGVQPDGVDATPPGPNPIGHHTVYPSVGMRPEVFTSLFKNLGWIYVYDKKFPTPFNQI